MGRQRRECGARKAPSDEGSEASLNTIAYAITLNLRQKSALRNRFLTGGEIKIPLIPTFPLVMRFSPSVSFADSSLVRGSLGAPAPVPQTVRQTEICNLIWKNAPVRGAFWLCGFCIQQICQGDTLKEIVDHLIQLVPHGLGLATFCAGAGGRSLRCAGHGSQAALG